jgi:hypothetical protein
VFDYLFDHPIFRVIATAATLVGVPVLVCVAYRRWVAGPRSGLAPWRNGLGLTALVLISLCWLWYAIALVDTRLTASVGVVFIDLTAVAVVCTIVATACAIAWDGAPRRLAVAACLLMGIGYHFFGYAHGVLKFSRWPHWLQYAVMVPHGIAGFLMFWIWWPKSDREWRRFGYAAAYLFVVYLIFIREF